MSSEIFPLHLDEPVMEFSPAGPVARSKYRARQLDWIALYGAREFESHPLRHEIR
jgi:hypothetical protein